MTNVSPKRTVAALLFLALTGEANAAEPLVLGALGDSLTAGFNSQNFGDNRKFSWSTGTAAQVNSIRQRLAEITGRPVVVHNEAIVGSEGSDLDRQVTRVIDNKPDFLTITIGANDICTWPEDYDADLIVFQAEVRNALSRLIEARPESKILMPPIPDVYRMYQIGALVSGCQVRWDLMNICRPLLAAGRNHEDRMRFVERWRLANQAIASAAAEFPDNVVHDTGVADTAFQQEHLSTIDCFHPSVPGQALFADVAWQLYLNH
jgi:lysophospholipase L1-like esterase